MNIRRANPNSFFHNKRNNLCHGRLSNCFTDIDTLFPPLLQLGSLALLNLFNRFGYFALKRGVILHRVPISFSRRYIFGEHVSFSLCPELKRFQRTVIAGIRQGNLHILFIFFKDNDSVILSDLLRNNSQHLSRNIAPLKIHKRQIVQFTLEARELFFSNNAAVKHNPLEILFFFHCRCLKLSNLFLRDNVLIYQNLKEAIVHRCIIAIIFLQQSAEMAQNSPPYRFSADR